MTLSARVTVHTDDKADMKSLLIRSVCALLQVNTIVVLVIKLSMKSLLIRSVGAVLQVNTIVVLFFSLA